MAKKKDNNKKRINPWWVWVLAIVICFGVWYGGAHWTRSYAQKHADDNTERVGQFGDSFGAVNALISALAFAGVIVTFWLQRKELDLQYDELKSQRMEFEQQNKTMKLQRFENTFFNMMQLQQQIVNDLHLQVTYSTARRGNLMVEGPTVTKELNGREVIRHIYDNVRQFVSNDGLDSYKNVNNRDLLDHYFRHLYTILRFVDESDVYEPEKDENGDSKYDPQKEWELKYRYTTILRATLSRYEMLILYYNGLSEFGRQKLKPLIEKYALLDNIDRWHLVPSREYKVMLGVNPSLKENRDWFIEHGLTGTDYEYYLTEDANDLSKYNIKAFGCGQEAMENSRQYITNLQSALEEIQKHRG